jgi:signal recognition particle subunit SRP54
MFASNGEKLEDFDVFHPERMAQRILGMGDVLTLIEQAERTFDREQAESMAAKLTSGSGFTLDDFLQQMQAVRKMGSLSKLLGMLPGMSDMREQIDNLDEREVDRVAAIIQSMTPAERHDPKILNASRRARIAKGSGTQVADVNSLVQRFDDARKMMASMGKRGGMPGMPGLGGLGGPGAGPGRGRPAKQSKQKAKAKRGSGNPAKRQAEAQAAQARRTEADDLAQSEAMAAFELPDELKKLLPPD